MAAARISTSIKKCFVPGCKSDSRQIDKIFVSLPIDRELRHKWYDAVNRKYSSTHYFVCCQDHFELPNDAENWLAFQLQKDKRLRIKKGVVPHKNLNLIAQKTEEVSEPSASDAKITFQPGKEIFSVPSTSSAEGTFHHEKNILSEPSTSSASGFHVKLLKSSVGVQVIPKIKNKSTGMDMTLEKTKTVTRDTSGGSTETDEVSTDDVPLTESTSSSEWCQNEYVMFQQQTLQKIERHSRFYLGIPEDMYYIIKIVSETCKMVTYVDIMIVLKKIRVKDTNLRLSIDFNLSESLVARIFNKNVTIISQYFKALIFWPTAESIYRWLPIPFRARYKNVQSIIDCLEIEIEKPSKAVFQSLTWNEFRKANTMKYLISCTPDGLINFISEGFGGHTADSIIVENSSYLEILLPGSAVLADRGFKHVENLLRAKGCILVRPPSTSSQHRASKEAVRESKRIASLRIHVEQVIRRLREFSMLEPHACIDHNLIPRLDSIVTIVCGIINMQSSIIRQYDINL